MTEIKKYYSSDAWIKKSESTLGGPDICKPNNSLVAKNKGNAQYTSPKHKGFHSTFIRPFDLTPPLSSSSQGMKKKKNFRQISVQAGLFSLFLGWIANHFYNKSKEMSSNVAKTSKQFPTKECPLAPPEQVPCLYPVSLLQLTYLYPISLVPPTFQPSCPRIISGLTSSPSIATNLNPFWNRLYSSSILKPLSITDPQNELIKTSIFSNENRNVIPQKFDKNTFHTQFSNFIIKSQNFSSLYQLPHTLDSTLLSSPFLSKMSPLISAVAPSTYTPQFSNTSLMLPNFFPKEYEKAANAPISWSPFPTERHVFSYDFKTGIPDTSSFFQNPPYSIDSSPTSLTLLNEFRDLQKDDGAQYISQNPAITFLSKLITAFALPIICSLATNIGRRYLNQTSITIGNKHTYVENIFKNNNIITANSKNHKIRSNLQKKTIPQFVIDKVFPSQEYIEKQYKKFIKAQKECYKKISISVSNIHFQDNLYLLRQALSILNAKPQLIHTLLSQIGQNMDYSSLFHMYSNNQCRKIDQPVTHHSEKNNLYFHPTDFAEPISLPQAISFPLLTFLTSFVISPFLAITVAFLASQQMISRPSRLARVNEILGKTTLISLAEKPNLKRVFKASVIKNAKNSANFTPHSLIQNDDSPFPFFAFSCFIVDLFKRSKNLAREFTGYKNERQEKALIPSINKETSKTVQKKACHLISSATNTAYNAISNFLDSWSHSLKRKFTGYKNERKEKELNYFINKEISKVENRIIKEKIHHSIKSATNTAYNASSTFLDLWSNRSEREFEEHKKEPDYFINREISKIDVITKEKFDYSTNSTINTTSNGIPDFIHTPSPLRFDAFRLRASSRESTIAEEGSIETNTPRNYFKILKEHSKLNKLITSLFKSLDPIIIHPRNNSFITFPKEHIPKTRKHPNWIASSVKLQDSHLDAHSKPNQLITSLFKSLDPIIIHPRNNSFIAFPKENIPKTRNSSQNNDTANNDASNLFSARRKQRANSNEKTNHLLKEIQQRQENRMNTPSSINELTENTKRYLFEEKIPTKKPEITDFEQYKQELDREINSFISSLEPEKSPNAIGIDLFVAKFNKHKEKTRFIESAQKKLDAMKNTLNNSLREQIILYNTLVGKLNPQNNKELPYQDPSNLALINDFTKTNSKSDLSVAALLLLSMSISAYKG